jgi:hypothetical protein
MGRGAKAAYLMSDDVPTIPAPASRPAAKSRSIVVDALGRNLEIKEMDPADQLDLFEACAANSTNVAWVGMALLVCSVTGIDNVPIVMPMTPMQVKALARRLGSEGIAAVSTALNTTPPDQSAVVDTAKN